MRRARAAGLTAVALAVGLVAVVPAYAGGDKSAKDIFYSPAPTAPQVTQQMALNYKILLMRNCNVQQVPDSFTFHGGDQFRLVFQSNIDGYLYLFNKGTTGASRMLFPDPRINGGSNRVVKYTEYVVPAAGWFVFDRNPGTEQLIVFLAPKTLANINYSPGGVITATSWQQVVAPYFATRQKAIDGKRTKDIVFVDEGQDVTPVPATPPTPSTPPPTPATPPPPLPAVVVPPVMGPPPPNLTPQMYVATQTTGAGFDSLLIHAINLAHR